MTNKFLFLLALVPAIGFGQQVKKINDKEKKETYYVLKTDMSVRHGEYKKHAYNNSILAKGFFKNGQRDSIWEFYGLDKKLIQKFNYSTNELVYNDVIDKEKDKKYKVLDGTDNSEIKLSRPPIFLGGKDYILSELMQKLQYPVDARENNISAKVYVTFTIDKFGKTSNYRVEKPFGHGLDEEAIRGLKLLPDNWLPGFLNGQSVVVEYVMPVSFQLN
jgi:protein TonB